MARSSNAFLILLPTLALAFFAAAIGFLHSADNNEPPAAASASASVSSGTLTPEQVAAANAAVEAAKAGRGDAPNLFVAVCSQCHGEKGEGKVELKTPSIAGLPEWYSKIQIGKFRQKIRGQSPEDTNGMIMHTVAQSLDDAAIEGVTKVIADLKLVPMQNTLGGDPDKGEVIFRERCMECHRYNGRGEMAFHSAHLIGLQDWYIISQLRKFRGGVRGSIPADVDGGKMHRITETMKDEQFIDVAAYVAVLAEKYADEKPRRRRPYQRLVDEAEADTKPAPEADAK
ncbi:MAG: cytochrome c [Verrucomicrobiae bacterium]|nr:cytochrome c [Verrucomicrobiae bacterium]MCP5551172.1 cytochrome c [Akkermansiaceae bacterium]